MGKGFMKRSGYLANKSSEIGIFSTAPGALNSMPNEIPDGTSIVYASTKDGHLDHLMIGEAGQVLHIHGAGHPLDGKPDWVFLKRCPKCKKEKAICCAFGYDKGRVKPRAQRYCKACRMRANVKIKYMRAYPNDKNGCARSEKFMRTKLENLSRRKDEQSRCT
jgi:hypothetical protein